MENIPYETKRAIDALVEDRISLQDAVVLAQRDLNTAEHYASDKWIEIGEKGPATTDGRAWRLLQFLWNMWGPLVCLHKLTGIKWPIVQTFLAKRLREYPAEFDHAVLEIVLHYAQDESLVRSAKEVEAGLLKGTGKQLRAQGVELSNDVAEVKTWVSKYHFDPDLNGLLDKVEHSLRQQSDKFDCASAIGQLRTFFETLHRQVAEKLRAAEPGSRDGTDLDKCQQVIDYLHRKDVTEEAFTKLGRGLFSVLSEKGSHAIGSEQEYVRLCRNMVVEYALVLFFEVKRRIFEMKNEPCSALCVEKT